jgi:hypothetical protein
MQSNVADSIQDDRIYLPTRLVAGFVAPFLVLAFIVLYLMPGRTAQYFAWEINPAMTAAFMGAGYLGGAWLLLNAVVGRSWRRVAAGFPPVIGFSIANLLTTFLHWERFDLNHLPFLAWFGLYLIAPFLVGLVWLLNRRADPEQPAPGDPLVPQGLRWTLRLIGIALLIFTVAGLANPDWLVQLWPWTLTPLTARVMASWAALLGVGGLVISMHEHWSGWKIGVQSIGIWFFLLFIGALVNRADFTAPGLMILYTLSVALVYLWLAFLYLRMEKNPD